MARPQRLSAADALRCDALMVRMERLFFADTRLWICERAEGETLEVAVGSGLNLPHYPTDVRLTGVDLSPAMLELAGQRARELGRSVQLQVADAQQLPFPDAAFDTVVCTFGLCEVPDDAAAIAEAIRVVRPGGSLLIADHVASGHGLLRAGQRALEWVTIPLSGEHFTRRPALHLESAGAAILASERFARGIIERIHARRPPVQDAGEEPAQPVHR